MVLGPAGAFIAGKVLGRVTKRGKRNPKKQEKAKKEDNEDRDAYDSSLASYGKTDGEDALIGRGWKRDPEFTGDNYTTWVKDGRVMVTFRGSQDAGDFAPDAGIAIGDYTNPAFTEASDLVGRVKAKYGGSKINTVGHSLGGTKAILAANAHGVQAIAFNPGSGVKGLDAGGHKVYKGVFDPISLTTSGSNVVYGLGGHELSDFEGKFY